MQALRLINCGDKRSFGKVEILELFNLQGALFLMILVGVVLKKIGIIDEAGKRCLTDVCINVIIPCNIVKSFLIEFDLSVLTASALLFAVATVVLLLCVLLNKIIFNRYPDQQKGVAILHHCV